ncbi:hypothetical protein EDD18DRAFT_1106776 [Armillaria luteobubalina]|uniref:Uncharacterized protein n=1 Tax=Armillaria luteobubalina TaxID=153913 RepID=A0AA39Q3Z8_9AGAR|nr:hypothetical protein EDD18DRAFT_1106776 [Armillaria luteobubalina]
MYGRPLPIEELLQNVNSVIPRRPGTSWARSKDFYWDISVFLAGPYKVQDVLFRVPTHQFIEKLETFRAMFTLPHTKTDTVEGISDNKPIHLDGSSPREISHKEWISILNLSTMWEMTEICNTAMSDLLDHQLKIDAIEQISLGQEYDVPALVTSGIVSLANQKGGLSEEQMSVLGSKMALHIQNIRIKLLENRKSAVRAVARDVFLGERSFLEPVKDVEGFEATWTWPP